MNDDIKGMRIKCAAIRLEDGRVFTGANHREAFDAGHAEEADRLMVNRAESGFVTECGRFVRRKPALRIAQAAGQLINEEIANWNTGLTSEDLK